jgi:hypothetical protein
MWSSKTSPDSCAVDPSSTPAIDAYAAGLIDGEGCIYVDKKHTLRIDVGVSEKGMPMLNWLQANYGGTIRQTRKVSEKWEAAFCWLLLADKAAAMLERLLPYLQLKTEQARLGIVMRTVRSELVRTPTGRVRWSEQGRERAAEIRSSIMALNRKGPTTTPTLAGDVIAQRAGAHWVTSQLNLLSEAGSTSFSETWPRAGMTRSGTAYRLRPLAPLTGGIGSGSLPTPKATDADRGGRGDLLQIARGNQSPSGHFKTWPTPHGICQPGPRRPGPSGNELGRAVNERETWGTPTARDWKDTGDMTNVPENGPLGRQVLNRQEWRTPQARDGDQRGPSDPQKRVEQGHSVSLHDQVGGSLNPTWVEWLMGFPLGWTDCGA